MAKARERHGHHGTRLYRIWSAMKRRCSNPKSLGYDRYGGRGITVCTAWQDFTAFMAWAYANGYTEGSTLDRIDGDAPYEPSNCRWASYRTQASHRSNTVMLTGFGETKSLVEWLSDSRASVPPATVQSRVSKGWGIERALTEPKSRETTRKEHLVDLQRLRELYESGKSVNACAKDLQVPRGVVNELVLALDIPAGVLGDREAERQAAYADLPYVVAVIRDGMTTREAAAKFGVSQTIVAQKTAAVRRSNHGTKPPTLYKHAAARREPVKTSTKTASPSPAAPTPNDQELNLIADMLRSAAQRLGMRPETLAHDMVHRLAD